MNQENKYTPLLLVFFTLLQVAYLYYSQTRYRVAFVLVLTAPLIQTYLLYQIHVIQRVDTTHLTRFLWANSLLMLLFPIFYSHQFIQGLWDSFLSSHELNPYLTLPNDPQVGRGITTVLYQILENKTQASNLAPAIQIIIKPFYVLYSKTNLITVILVVKFILLSLSGLLWHYYNTLTTARTLWIIPGIWLFGFSQANPELLGLLCFLWGYHYIRNKEDEFAGLAILGASALFGLPYFLMSLFVIHKKELIKPSWIFAVSFTVWMAIPFNAEAFIQWAFYSDWDTTFLFFLMNQHLPPIWISVLSLLLIFVCFTALFFTQKNSYIPVFISLFLILSPLGTQTLFGLITMLIIFEDDSPRHSTSQFSLVISTVYTLLLIAL